MRSPWTPLASRFARPRRSNGHVHEVGKHRDPVVIGESISRRASITFARASGSRRSGWAGPLRGRDVQVGLDALDAVGRHEASARPGAHRPSVGSAHAELVAGTDSDPDRLDRCTTARANSYGRLRAVLGRAQPRPLQFSKRQIHVNDQVMTTSPHARSHDPFAASR